MGVRNFTPRCERFHRHRRRGTMLKWIAGGDKPMNRYRSINIRLEQRELDALVKVAQNELRQPRDQARYILLKSLGLAEKPPSEGKHNGAEGLGTRTGAAVTTLQAPSKY